MKRRFFSILLAVSMLITMPGASAAAETVESAGTDTAESSEEVPGTSETASTSDDAASADTSDTEEEITETASGTCGDDLTWVLTSDGTLTISGTGEMEDYESTVGTNPPWYSYKSRITFLVLEGCVTNIGNSAFYECTSLTSVSISDSVTSIGERAFSYCTSLTSISVPDSVISIGTYAFRGCTSLKSVSVPDSVTSIGEWAFYDCTSLTSISIPDSVISIGKQAFRGCSSLKSVSISNSVTSIAGFVFMDCDSLTSISIPDSVTSIGTYAFYDCDSLTSISIPDSVTSIGTYAFCYCKKLTDVYYSGTASEWAEISILSYNNRLTSATIHYNSSGSSGAGSYESSSDTFRFGSIGFGTYADYENPASVTIGEEFALVGLFTETDDTETDYAAITWSLSDDSVAEVTDTGSLESNDALVDDGETDMQYSFAVTLKALRPGDVTLTGTTADGNTASYTLHVLPKITLTGDSVTASAAEWTCTVSLDYADADFLDEYMAGLSFYTVYEDEDAGTVRTSDWNGDSSYTISSDGLSAVLTMEFVPDGDSGSVRYVAVEDADGYVTTSENTLTYCTTNISLVFTDENGEAYAYQDNITASWDGNTYSSEEIYAALYFTYYPEDPDDTITLTDAAFTFTGADAFKIDTDSITGSDNLTLSYGETYSGTITLVQRGLLWDVPDEGETDTGILTGTITASDGTSWADTATVYVTNPSEDADDADTDNTDTDEDTEAALTAAADAYADIESSMALDAQLDTYLGDGWTDVLKTSLYTEILNINMSEEYWEETGFSEEIAEAMISKFLGVSLSSVSLGVVNTTVPVSETVETEDYGTVLVNLTANINNFTAGDDPYALFGTIDTELVLNYGTDDAETVTLSDGVITQVDVEDFANAVWSLASKQLKSAYGTGTKIDSLLNKLGLNYVAEKYSSYLLVEPVVQTIEWFQTLGLLKKVSTYKIICDASTAIIAHCPVDLYIYNSDGELVGQTSGDEIVTAGDDIVLYTQGESKTAILYDDTYTVSYVSTGTGTMTLEIYDNANADSSLRVCTFEELPLAEGLSYTQTVDSTLLSDVSGYTLVSSEDEKLEPDTVEYPGEETDSDGTDGDETTEDDSSGNSDSGTVEDDSPGDSDSGTVEDDSSSDADSGSSSTSKIKIAKVVLSTTTYTYSGKARKPSVKVYDSNGKKISSSNYTVTYASGRKNCGRYKVTVKGKGSYTGTKTVYFKIKPKKASTPKLTSSSKKKLKVKWTKSGGSVTGYQVAYRVKGGKWKYVTVKSNSKTLTKLKSGKTYQVKVRAYKTISGKKVYGSWSKVKSKKVK